MRMHKRLGLLFLFIGLSGCGGATGTVTVQPSRVTLSPGQQQVFSVTLTQCSDSQVTWRVQEGSEGGSITSNGVYTAPSASGIYHVQAECTRDSRINDIAEITVN